MATESRLVKFVTNVLAIESGWLAWLLIGFAVGGVALFVQRAWHLAALWCVARSGQPRSVAASADLRTTVSRIGPQIHANPCPSHR